MAGEFYRARLDAINRRRAEQQVREQEEARTVQAGGTVSPTALSELPSFDPDAISLPDPNPGILGRAIQGLTFAVEPLVRTTQAFRETLLFTNKKTSFKGFQRRFQGALKGDVKMSARDFSELMVGASTWKTMERTELGSLPKWLPSWVKGFIVPEHAVSGNKPARVNVADIFSVGVDFGVDPFTVLPLTPVGSGVKLAGALSKLPGGAKVVKGLTFPYRVSTRAINSLIGPNSNSPLAIWNLWRQPEDVLTGLQKPIFDDILEGVSNLNINLEELGGRASVAGKGLKYRSDSDRRIAAYLHTLKVGPKGNLVPGVTRLSKDELQIADSFRDIIDEQMALLVKKGVKFQSGLKLEDFLPRLAGRTSIPMDIWQSWSVDKLGKLNPRLINDENFLANAKGVKFENLSAIDSVRDFLYVARRKIDLEPALLKHAPKRGRVGESVAIAGASRWQRRYVTDLINEFQGNNRGRKMIEFDIAVGEFFQKLGQQGPRVESLLKKSGLLTRDGLPDFSPTTKISGMMSHNIIRATLGGRLRSAIQNTTQTFNFAISRGIPATIKGMLGMFDKERRGLRASQKLLDDFQGMWRDDVWVESLGKKYDEVIFKPFNLAESLIRGTGWNVGIDEWLKTVGKRKGVKTISEARAAGLESEMLLFARKESINGAFIYGTLGRPPALSNPLLRPATTLLSFPFKQGEFLRREFQKDPSALLRFIGLHGFLIEKANEHLGIAAEDFLGWGFLPMTRSFGGIQIPTSPPVSLLLDTSEGLSALARGDFTLAERKFDRAKRDLPLALGVSPVPWLGIRDIAQLKERVSTKRQELAGGTEFVPITTGEAVTNFLISRTTTQKLRADLNRRITRAKKKVDFTLDKRALGLVEAAMDPSQEGDKLAQAAWDLAQPIEIEGQKFWPDESQVESRLNTLMEKRFVSQDVRRMNDTGFLMQVFLWAHLELLERAGVQ